MEMTHYMQLLADNQPWNLLMFMAIPVVLAETVAVTELYILFTRNFSGLVRKINSIAGSIVGIYFIGVFFYLLYTAVIPLTTSGGWRGLADIVAVGFYLLGVIPLGGLALLEFGLIKKNADQEEKLRVHAILVAVFLVVAHIAMIFGMLNPTVIWWQPDSMALMQGMTQ
ncbi:MAG: Permease [Parcubacteria bacterium C7867-006]|nr:MAG: Permease [Parcubacteria bacterium C7867-006]